MNNDIEYSGAGLAVTENAEGCKLKAYQDSGDVWTIGYGHTAGVTEGMICTQAQAEAWLKQDVAIAEWAVKHLVQVDLTQGEYDALVDFVFNIGETAFAASTMLRLLNQGDFDGAANEFEKWDHVSGQVVAGLLRRRQAEKAEFVA